MPTIVMPNDNKNNNNAIKKVEKIGISKAELIKKAEDKGKTEFKIKVSDEALRIAENIKINWDDFMDWYVNNKCVIGSGHVLEYISKFSN